MMPAKRVMALNFSGWPKEDRGKQTVPRKKKFQVSFRDLKEGTPQAFF